MSTPPRSPGGRGRLRRPRETGCLSIGHDAYRRGLCRDCFTAWHSAGRPRCDACHDIYASSGGAAALTVVARGTQRKWSVAAAAAAAAGENRMSGNAFPYRGGVW